MELSVKDLKDLIVTGNSYQDHPYEIGKEYLIRTVTMIYTGRLIYVYENELVIEDAAWIAETERWADSLTTGKFDEIEPYPQGKIIIGRGAILDVSVWNHDLPRDQK